MTTSRRTFKRGDRVRLSEDGREQHPHLANGKSRGVIVGFGRGRDWIVRVRIDGSTMGRPFAARLWEIDPDHATASPSPSASGEESADGRG